MDFFESFLGYFVLFFGIGMVVFIIRTVLDKRKLRGFQGYFTLNFPDLPQDLKMLTAKQKSKGMRMDIVLIINDAKEEIILILDNKGEGMRHVKFPFSGLKSTDSTSTIISRGALPKQYSYERTILLNFEEGGVYKIIQEFPSNKRGSDKGADIVMENFAPWEKRLKDILA